MFLPHTIIGDIIINEGITMVTAHSNKHTRLNREHNYLFAEHIEPIEEARYAPGLVLVKMLTDSKEKKQVLYSNSAVSET